MMSMCTLHFSFSLCIPEQDFGLLDAVEVDAPQEEMLEHL